MTYMFRYFAHTFVATFANVRNISWGHCTNSDVWFFSSQVGAYITRRDNWRLIYVFHINHEAYCKFLSLTNLFFPSCDFALSIKSQSQWSCYLLKCPCRTEKHLHHPFQYDKEMKVIMVFFFYRNSTYVNRASNEYIKEWRLCNDWTIKINAFFTSTLSISFDSIMSWMHDNHMFYLSFFVYVDSPSHSYRQMYYQQRAAI